MSSLINLSARRRVPLIRQAEGAECGLACLAMVASYHGYRCDLPSLRRRFSISLRGTSLKGMLRIADRIGFHARPLRCETEHLGKLALPAILHWNLDHFLVLTKVVRGPRGVRFQLHDPAVGERDASEQELTAHFTGVVVELTPTRGFEVKDARTRLKLAQLWSPIPGASSSLLQAGILSLILQGIVLLSPVQMQAAIDTVLPSSDRGMLAVLALGFGVLTIVNAAALWLRNTVLLSLSSVVSYQMLLNLFRHWIRLPLSWFEKRQVGDIISRFGSTQPITDILTRGLLVAIVDGLLALTTLIVMMLYSPLLSAIALAAMALHYGVQRGFLHRSKRLSADLLVAISRENTTFIETARGIAAIKAFDQESNRFAQWQNRKADAVNAGLKAGRLSIAQEIAGVTVTGAENVLFVFAGIHMTLDGTITVGMLFAFLLYKQQFLAAGVRLIRETTNLLLLEIHLDRIADIATSEPEIDDPQASSEQHCIRGAIELRNVCFSYGDEEPDVLKDVSLLIQAGETVAVTGPSGGGKTTLMKCVIGLLRPTAGEILVDGYRLDALGRHAYRQQIGVVAQDDVLYAGTVLENISFFDPEADMARAVEVAKLAMIHEDIASMPMRYDSLVGDMGSALSGGQKQRLLLARALYRRPRILFIDEGTAHLDAKTEAAVNASIRSLGITRVVIAHRKETLQSADRLVTLVSGQIADDRCFRAIGGGLGLPADAAR